MSKSVFLYVYGDDYSALDFGRNNDPMEFYKKMVSNNETHVTLDDDYYAEVKIIEFDEVISDKFFDFLKEQLCDYDDLKAADLIKVG